MSQSSKVRGRSFQVPPLWLHLRGLRPAGRMRTYNEHGFGQSYRGSDGTPVNDAYAGALLSALLAGHVAIVEAMPAATMGCSSASVLALFNICQFTSDPEILVDSSHRICHSHRSEVVTCHCCQRLPT